MATRKTATTRRKRTRRGDRHGDRDALQFLDELIGEPLTFANLLSSIRQCEEMTQADLARKLGLTRSHVSDIENGRKVVSPARAARFARILGYSETQFVQLALQSQVSGAGLKMNVRVGAT